MLLSVTGPASDAIRAVFLRTRDDLLVLGCLRGFRSHARACVYLGLLAPFDAALVFFFRRGLEYASAAAEGAAGPPLPGEGAGVHLGRTSGWGVGCSLGCVLFRSRFYLWEGLGLVLRCSCPAWCDSWKCVARSRRGFVRSQREERRVVRASFSSGENRVPHSSLRTHAAALS